MAQHTRFLTVPRRAALQARHGLEKLHSLVGAEHDRQLARLACVRNAFGNFHLPERHAVEKPHRADDLVEPRPRDAGRDQMHLESVNILDPLLLRRTAKIPAELRNRANEGSLRHWRQIADRHVFNHAAAKRA